MPERLVKALKFHNELLRARTSNVITTELTRAFREAAIASSTLRNWALVATIAAEYAVHAKDAGSEAAFLEGLHTFEGAVAMGGKATLRPILTVERRAAKMRQKSRKR